MYSGHARLSISVSVCLSLAAFQYYCMDPDVTWGIGMGCLLVVHWWADLQSVHGFRCYDNITLNAKCQRVLLLAVCLVCHCIKILKCASHNSVLCSTIPRRCPVAAGRKLDCVTAHIRIQHEHSCFMERASMVVVTQEKTIVGHLKFFWLLTWHAMRCKKKVNG